MKKVCMLKLGPLIGPIVVTKPYNSYRMYWFVRDQFTNPTGVRSHDFKSHFASHILDYINSQYSERMVFYNDLDDKIDMDEEMMNLFKTPCIVVEGISAPLTEYEYCIKLLDAKWIMWQAYNLNRNYENYVQLKQPKTI